VEAARQQPSGTRTLWIVAGAIAAVALAAIIAVAVSGSEDAETIAGGSPSPSGGTVIPAGSLEYGDVQVAGNALVALPRGEPDPAVGDTIPTIDGVAFDDSALSIAPGGKPKVIMALAHWCPHCQAEVPRIQEWLDANGMPTDVDLYAIATGTTSSRPNHPPDEWLRGEGWSVPTLVDDEEGTAGQALGLSSYPFFVVVDASGQVVLRTSGELTTEQWEAVLEAARTGAAGGSDSGGESSPAG
jgi:thiol-disulfide isomerase/thioredoxin